MKIALLNNLYYPYQVGGAERSVQLLAEGLLGQGHQVIVITLNKPGNLLRQESINGVHIYRISPQPSYWPFSYESSKPNILYRAFWYYRDRYNRTMGQEVKKILEHERPALLHTHNLTGFSVSVWAAAKSLGLPVVHTTRDYSLLCYRGMYRNDRNCAKPCKTCLAFSRIKRRVSRLVDLAVGISHFVLDRHLTFAYFPNARHAVVYNPVSVAPKRPVNSAEKNNPQLHLGYLGRLTPHKGIEDLLTAVEQLTRRNLPVKLSIAGQGDRKYEEMLWKRAKGLPVTFLGHTSPEELFHQIDILVVPSRWHEPFGRVVAEAFANGIPVIAANRGGIPEIVEKGCTGWLYEPNDPEALIGILTRITEYPKVLTPMRAEVLRKAQNFTVEAHVHRYTELYNTVTLTG